MNKDLLEKVSAIREDLEYLVAISALGQAGDAKKLAELVKQKDGSFMSREWKVVNVSWRAWDKYRELFPYMTLEQGSRAANGVAMFKALADAYFKRGIDHYFTDAVTKHVPQMLADLDVLAEKFAKPGSELIEKVSAIREILLAWSASVTDLKKLAELVMQKKAMVMRNYEELYFYMSADQKRRPRPIGGFETAAENYLAVQNYLATDPEDADFVRLTKDYLTRMTTFLPQMLADLDALEREIKKKPSPES
jgi:hypothetical protein